MNRSKTIAVTGIGCLCAAGGNLAQCMDSLFTGRQPSAPPTRFSSSHPTRYPVFEIQDEFTQVNTVRTSGILRTARMAVAAAGDAFRDAGWSRAMAKEKRVGVCIGTTVGSAMNNEEFYRDYRRGRHPEMTAITRFLNSNPAQVIAREFGLAGPCQTVVNACSSGTDAIGLGAAWIRSGVCDAVIAGGADELCRVTYNGFISLMIADESTCRPFDAHRKGLNLGEGAAVLVLESEKLRRAGKQPPRAVVVGYGSACDAFHLTAPTPDGSGLKRALAAALTASNKTATDIGFVNAHGTGTPDNDHIESKVLHEMLPEVPFLSTKGYTGHTLGAAGAIEAAFTVACLEAQKIPTSAGFTTPDPEMPMSPVGRETELNSTTAISQSLAFGGNNAVLVFEKGDT